MEREFDTEWRRKAAELFDFLKDQPTSIPTELRPFFYECQDEAEAIRGDDDFPTWRARCEEKKIPYGIKPHGYYIPFPATENQYHCYDRAKARKGLKHAQTSLRKAGEADVFLPTTETNISKITSLVNFPKKAGDLIDLLKEEEDESE